MKEMFVLICQTQTVQICGRANKGEFVANTAGCSAVAASKKKKKRKTKTKTNQNKCHALVTSAQALAGMQHVTAQWLPHLNYDQAKQQQQPKTGPQPRSIGP